MNSEAHPSKIKIMIAVIGFYILLPVGLFILAKHFLLITTYTSYLFVAAAIFFLVSRFGKVTLGSSPKETPVFTLPQWIGILIAGQLTLYFLFYSFTHTALSYVPAVPKDSDFFMILRQGLYPWPMVAVLSVLLGYYFYCKNQPGLLISALPSLSDRNEDVFVKRVMQMLMAVPLTFVLAACIAMGALQLASLFSHIGNFSPSYELDFVNIILGLFFFLLLSSKYYKKMMNYLNAKEISIGSFLLGFMIGLSVLFTIANLIAVYLHIHPLKTITLPRVQWNLLMWTWWTGWSVLFASFVARISSGRTVREIILGVLLLPTVLLVLFFYFPISFKWIGTQHILLDLLALAGPFAIIFLLSRVDNTSFLMFGFIPKTKSVIKTDNGKRFIPPFLQIIAFLSFAYLLFGLNFFSFLSVVAIYSGFILFLIITLLFVTKVYRNLPKTTLSTEQN